MKKIVSFLLTLVLLLSLVPTLPVTHAEATNTANRDFVTLKKDNSTIAPGVEQEIVTVRKKYNNQQLVYYMMTIDTDNKDTQIHVNYKDNDWQAYLNGHYGLQAVKDQMDAAQKNHSNIPNFTVVGGINGTGYDMSNGNSNTYTLMMEGHELNVASNANQGFFGVTQSGKAMIGWSVAEYKAARDNREDPLVEALGDFGTVLIKNGVINESCDWAGAGAVPDCNARTAVGVTEDGDAVFLVVDGKQSPFSEGCDMYELAQILKKAGCYNAFNWDGGGSTTYVSRPEGEATYRVVSRPCDGAPRSVATSLYVVSTAPDDKQFNRASIDADTNYITPGGTVNLTAVGITAAGTPMEIPKDVEWSYSGEAGILSTNGDTAVFTANGTQSEDDVKAVISMMKDGETFGTAEIHVVKPNVFKLSQTSYMVPYGKTMPFEVTAAYSEGENEHPVTLHGDFTFKLDQEGLGELNGNIFTAHVLNAPDAVDNGAVTATLSCNQLSVTAPITLGRGSETVFNFEDEGQISHFYIYNTSEAWKTRVTLEYASDEDGHVHSGQHSMRVTLDYVDARYDSTSGTGGAASMEVRYQGDDIQLKGAVGFGAWIWVPDEETNFGLNPMFDNQRLDTISYQRKGSNYDEGHWEWVYLDPTEFLTKTSDENPFTVREGDSIGFWLYKSPEREIYENLANKWVFYIDDFMVDYSPVTPDREAPTIESVKTHKAADVYDNLERGQIYDFGANNQVAFNADVQEDSGFNATGIDPDSVVALIDGNNIGAKFFNNQIVTDSVTVADGVHTLKLYISDNEGNTTNQTRQFRVNAGSSAPTITLARHDPDGGRVLTGSVCYVDVNATDISKIQKVDMTLDLVNNVQWEITHADVDPKFEMSNLSIDEYENTATVTFTRTTPWKEGDSNTIASLPVRMWLDTTYPKDYEKNQFSPRIICVDVDYGRIEYTDDYTTDTLPAFGSECVRIESELFGPPADVKAAYPDKTYWHVHDTELVDVENVEATCTSRGLTGRKICKTCGSPVDEESWGTIVDVKPHDYRTNDNGELACTMCKELFTGVWTDDKTYVNGVCLDGWQDDGTYYNDGVKVGEGLHPVKDADGVERWYLFGENGVCGTDDRGGYTGYYTESEGVRTVAAKLPADSAALETNKYYYIEGGEPYNGWLFFNKEGKPTSPEETKPTNPIPDGEEEKDKPSGEKTDTPTAMAETSGTPEIEPGMPDPSQQQAILDMVAYHVHPDGRVHSVSMKDTRKCVESGYIEYTCTACKEQTKSEKLWWVGHKWRDPDNGDYVCTVPECGTVGRDIGKASLNIMGERFDYTGGLIRAAVYVYDNNKSLLVRSDKNGTDGYVWYENNQDIGVATVHIRGEGDYYGELTGTFEIVPKSVTKVTKTETACATADKVTVNLTWDESPGATYYDVFRYDYVAKQWITTKVTTNHFSEELPLGTEYGYVVASRAEKDGKTYLCALWSDSVYGVIEHVWGAEQNKTEPGCETEGSYTHVCQDCGFEEKVTVPATGHKVDNWTTTVAPTYTSAGSRTGACSVCGEEVTETLSPIPPVITGTGNTTSPDARQETVENADGSTTTTTTKPDGSTTETTTKTDGTVTEKNTDKSGVVTETTTKPDNTVTEKVTQTDGSATERTTTPDGVVGQKNTDAEGKVTSAEVVIPKEAEKQDVVTAPVEVPAAKTAAEAPEISVRTESAESNKVEIPVTEFGPGTVAIVVHADGTEEVVRDCTIGENGVVLNVEGDVTLKIVDKAETFADVEDTNHWASTAVEFVAARELFKGTAENKFTPNGSMTRGMMVTVLYRLAYEPDAVEEGFADVKSDAYYSDAVAWAAENGVVNGYADNTFAPDDNVSREQLVTILHRYAQKKGYATETSGTLANFADAKSVSSWASDAMSWAVELGLVNGTDASHISPAKSATRAEVATILMRFCEKVVK